MKSIIRLSHVCLSSSNLENTIYFYCGLLGLEVVHEFFNAEGLRYGVLIHSGNGTFLEYFLKQELDTVEKHEKSGFRHICFQVTDLKEITSLFPDRELKVVIGKTDFVPQVWITDPDGYLVEFHEYSNTMSPQFRYV